MAVHQVTAEPMGQFDDFYSLPVSGKRLPKYRVPASESSPRAVRMLIHDKLELESNGL